jgi:hypothetical protein
MLKDIKKVKDIIHDLLKNYPELRDNDHLLYLAYLNTKHDLKTKIGNVAYCQLKKILLSDDCAKLESIRRVRQSIQENGEFQGEKRKLRKAFSIEHL